MDCHHLQENNNNLTSIKELYQIPRGIWYLCFRETFFCKGRTMYFITKKPISIVITCLLCVFLVSCGGGGGGDNGGASSVPDVTSNAGFSGRIFVVDGWIIDIPSGRSKRAPGVVWDKWCTTFFDDSELKCTDATEYDFDVESDFLGFPSNDGEEFVVTVDDCNGRSLDCFMSHNLNNGNVTSYRGEISYGLSDAKLSRDRNYFAYIYNKESNGTYANTELHIVDRDFQNISSTTMPDHYGIGFDWSNNGQIVYGYKRNIYLTSPYSTQGVIIFSLNDYPEFNDMELSGPFRVSPDGTKVAFKLVEEDNRFSYKVATPWVINIDGSDIHRLAHVPDEDSVFQLFGSIAWSPDGRYIMLTEGYSPQATSVDTGVQGDLYIIPSDSRDVAINDEGKNNVVRLVTNYKNENKSLRYEFNGRAIWWLP